MSDAQTVNSPLVKPRDYWFDNAKAFLIICVVIGHLANGTFSTSADWVVDLQRFIYVFHMPAFMIISGRFARKRVNRGDWVSVISKMIVPYIIFQTAFLVLFSALGATPGKFSYFNPLFGLWYFLNVGVYTIVTTYLKKYNWLFPASIVAGLFIGFALGRLYGGFHRIVTFYPFFLFGYYTAVLDFEFLKKKHFRIACWAAFLVLAVYMFNYSGRHSWGLLCMDENYFSVMRDMTKRGYDWSLLETFAHSILRYVVGFASFFMVMGMMPTKKTVYSYIGQNSVYVYVLHTILIVILREVDEDYDILRILTNNLMLILYCFSGIPLSFLLASEPVRKLTSFFVEPNVDIRRMARKIIGIRERKN